MGIGYVWGLLGEFLHGVTVDLCIRVVISVCFVCGWRFLCELVSIFVFLWFFVLFLVRLVPFHRRCMI